LRLTELHIDRAYLASDMVRQRGGDLAVYCKAWRVRNSVGRYATTGFTLDFTVSETDLPGRSEHGPGTR
jgi:transposase